MQVLFIVGIIALLFTAACLSFKQPREERELKLLSSLTEAKVAHELSELLKDQNCDITYFKSVIALLANFAPKGERIMKKGMEEEAILLAKRCTPDVTETREEHGELSIYRYTMSFAYGCDVPWAKKLADKFLLEVEVDIKKNKAKIIKGALDEQARSELENLIPMLAVSGNCTAALFFPLGIPQKLVGEHAESWSIVAGEIGYVDENAY
jgi:hypothetical protein